MAPHRPRLLISVHNAGRGGAELMALAEAEFLKDFYELLIAVPEGPLRADFANCGELVASSPRLPLYGAGPKRWLSRSARTAADAARLTALIRRRRTELVLVNSMVSLSPLIAARAAGVPSILNPRYDASQARDRWWRTLFPQVCALEGALASTVIAISDGIEWQFGGARRARIVRIADGVPIPAEAARNGKGFHTPLRLCMVGGIDPVKSQHVAVEALSRLDERGIDATLELVGPERDPDYASRLRERAGALGVTAKVRFAGETGDVDSALRRADILLHTSSGEATPLILMEALARAKPVVATRVGDVPRIVNDGETGLLTLPGDADGVADAVARHARDPRRARAMAVLGRERTIARYSREKNLRLLRAEIDRALSLRRGAWPHAA